MAELRTEEEQVEAIKKWWKENGTTLILTVVIVFSGWFGWNFWQDQKQQTQENASQLYNQLVQTAVQPAVTEAGLNNMKALATELKTEYAGTSYAEFGTLFLARFAAEEGNYDEAVTELTNLVENSKHEPVKYTAQARLAQVYIQQEKLDEALALVSTSPSAAYTSQFEEAKGDALYLKGEFAEAQQAYKTALEAAQKIGLRANSLQRKLDMLASSGDI